MEFLDETDVDSYLYLNIFDNFQSQQRKVPVSKGSNEKSVAFKSFYFCDTKTQQRYIPQEQMIISKRELSLLFDSLHNFLKPFDKESKCLQIPLRKPKIEIGYSKSKDNLFANYYEN